MEKEEEQKKPEMLKNAYLNNEKIKNEDGKKLKNSFIEVLILEKQERIEKVLNTRELETVVEEMRREQ